MGQELKHMNLWGTFLFKRPDLESLLCMECHTHHGPVRRILSDSSLFLQCPQRALTRVDTYRYVVKSSNLPSSSKCVAPPSPCCLGQTLRSHSRNLYFLYYLEPTQCHHQIACAAHRFQWSPCWGGGSVSLPSPTGDLGPEGHCSPSKLCSHVIFSRKRPILKVLPRLALLPSASPGSVALPLTRCCPSLSGARYMVD